MPKPCRNPPGVNPTLKPVVFCKITFIQHNTPQKINYKHSLAGANKTIFPLAFTHTGTRVINQWHSAAADYTESIGRGKSEGVALLTSLGKVDKFVLGDWCFAIGQIVRVDGIMALRGRVWDRSPENRLAGKIEEKNHGGRGKPSKNQFSPHKRWTAVEVRPPRWMRSRQPDCCRFPTPLRE